MTDLLARIRSMADSPDPLDGPVAELLAELATERDPGRLARAGRLLAEIPVGRLPGRPLRVAVVGTFTADHVGPLLRVALLRGGIAPDLLVTGFDQLVVQLTDPGSELAAFAPDVTLCLLHDRWFLPAEWDPTDPTALSTALRARLDLLSGAVDGFVERTGGTVLLHTVPLSTIESSAVIAYRARAGLGRRWRELNSELLALGERGSPVYTTDFEAVLADHPGPVRDERLYRFASMAWTTGVEARFAAEAATFCRAVTGLAKKVLVLDLDNTLWGGVVGDDGPGGVALGSMYPGNGYLELQRKALALRRQGVLLAVCSKNDESIVDTMLAAHPEQLLRSADFVAREINWEPKDGNLRRLAERLNLGLDSLVFADDSTFECELVRHALPEVTVVPLAGDPAEHASSVLADGLFTVLATTETDRVRTETYRAGARRGRFAAATTSVREYLDGLDLRVRVAPADEYSIPRLVQLSLRTNQFTMTGRAHPEAVTRAMAVAPDAVVLGFEVADRFGREGIVGGAWIATGGADWLIENFVMSCRVFSRGIEHAVLHHVLELATASAATGIAADFRATGRNQPAATCYPDAGFALTGEHDGVRRYRLALPAALIAPEWITVEREDTVHV
jgi:FkbH-like protein